MAVNEEELRRYLNVVKRAVSLIEGMLDNDDGGMMEQLMEGIPQPQPQLVPEKPLVMQEAAPCKPFTAAPDPQPAQPNIRKKHIEDLLAIDCWPEAVPAHLLNNEGPSDEDQVNRANAVLDFMIDRSIEGGTFLDFGCGEGWITQEASKRGVTEAMGYDIIHDDNWNKRQLAKFTSNFETLPQGHFDYIMLYDVLDHCEDPMLTMSQVKSLLKPDGVVFIRCHPWPSKHAMHLWKQGLNQAHLHLFLSWDELRGVIGDSPMFTRVEKDPIEAYHWWFNEFNIAKERLTQEDVSEFFFVPAFKELLANEQQIPVEQIDDFLARMRISFVDYVLEQK
jgi:SAM-dependent methyltransferase